jgi:regulator of RNase E activity RraB
MPIDLERLQSELAADADVIRSLRENGDLAAVVRPVDVSFKSDDAAIARVRSLVAGTEWRILQEIEMSDGEMSIDIQRDQTTDEGAIRSLTESALEIEDATGAAYDGWGTVAQTQPKISN